MLFDQKPGFIWLDGKFLNWSEAKIHVGSHGLHYGSSIFEGIRAYEGIIFKLDEHIQRFFLSAKTLDFELNYSEQYLKNMVYEVLKKQDLKYAYIRPIAFRGSDELKIAARPRVITAILIWDFVGNYLQEHVNAVSLTKANLKKPPVECHPYQAKMAGMYPMITVEVNRAKELGFDDCIFLDTNNFVTEASSSNIFMVSGNVLYTPKTDCILDGITRQTIIEIANKENLTVIEKNITLDELKNAQEVFLTGTACGIISVKCIDDVNYDQFNFSNFFRIKYKELINEEIQRQYNSISNTF